MKCDVVIIGAGPSGAVAGALLSNLGYHVMIFEKQRFPRFSIGESLLPQCMHFLEKAGMLDAVEKHKFQHKNGAAFSRGNDYSEFRFSDKFSNGWDTTFQVLRSDFDMILAEQAELAGVEIHYEVYIVGMEVSDNSCRVRTQQQDGVEETIETRFVLDASGFGRVLPRLLDLELPSNFPSRVSLFTHIEDQISGTDFDRNKILICVHPSQEEVWYWLIPFSNGRCSIGVVAPTELLRGNPEKLTEELRKWISEEPRLCRILEDAKFDTPVRSIEGYSCNVKKLYGEGFALLGNAGEFLDPIFSSGVTIAMKSADLAVNVLDRQLQGHEVDWQEDFATPLKQGIDTFRAFVEAWYSGKFQDIAFTEQHSPKIKAMLCSVLAGYAWDRSNPYVKESQRRINTLAEICRSQ